MSKNNEKNKQNIIDQIIEQANNAPPVETETNANIAPLSPNDGAVKEKSKHLKDYIYCSIILFMVVSMVLLLIYFPLKHKGEVSNLTTEITSLNATITSLEGQVTELNGKISTLKTGSTTLNTQVTSLNAEIFSLKNSLNNLSDDIDNLTTDNSELKQETSELKTQIIELETTADTLTTKVNALQTKVDTISSNNTTLISENGELKTQVTTLTSTVGGLNTQITTLETNVTSLTTQVSTLQQQLSALADTLQSSKEESDTKITALETTVSSLSTSLTTMSTSVESLSSQVSSLTNEVQAMQEDMYKLNTYVLSTQKPQNQEDTDPQILNEVVIANEKQESVSFSLKEGEEIKNLKITTYIDYNLTEILDENIEDPQNPPVSQQNPKQFSFKFEIEQDILKPNNENESLIDEELFISQLFNNIYRLKFNSFYYSVGSLIENFSEIRLSPSLNYEELMIMIMPILKGIYKDLTEAGEYSEIYNLTELQLSEYMVDYCSEDYYILDEINGLELELDSPMIYDGSSFTEYYGITLKKVSVNENGEPIIMSNFNRDMYDNILEIIEQSGLTTKEYLIIPQILEDYTIDVPLLCGLGSNSNINILKLLSAANPLRIVYDIEGTLGTTYKIVINQGIMDIASDTVINIFGSLIVDALIQIPQFQEIISGSLEMLFQQGSGPVRVG